MWSLLYPNYVSVTEKRIVFSGHSETVVSVALHPREPLFYSGSMDKTARVWKIDSGVLALRQGKS